jgi:hypothetical protein
MRKRVRAAPGESSLVSGRHLGDGGQLKAEIKP